MTSANATVSSLLVWALLAIGCGLGGGQAMPMAASQPDLRAPSEKDPALHVSECADGSTPHAIASQSAAHEDDTRQMAMQMKELGAQVKEMGEKMQSKEHAMKSPKAATMPAMDPGTVKGMGAKMKDVGAKMQKKGRMMQTAKAKQSPGAAAAPMDPAMMMKMGSEMMGMGGQMMEPMEAGMDGMDPAMMMKMGSEMMGMGGQMMEPMEPMEGVSAPPAAAPAAPMPHM